MNESQTPSSQTHDAVSEPERRRRIRRNVWLLALLAIGFYAGFIVLSLTRTP